MKTAPTYPEWRMTYSNENFDRTQALAYKLTDADRTASIPGTPAHGYSLSNFNRAEGIVRAAKRA